MGTFDTFHKFFFGIIKWLSDLDMASMATFDDILRNQGFQNCIVAKIISYLDEKDQAQLCLVSKRCEEIVFDLSESRLSSLFASICKNHDQYQSFIIEKFVKRISISDARLGLQILLSSFKCKRKSVNHILDAFPALQTETICTQKKISVQVESEENITDILKFLCDSSYDGFYHQGDLISRILQLMELEQINLKLVDESGQDMVGNWMLELATASKNRDAIIALLFGLPRLTIVSKAIWESVLQTFANCSEAKPCKDFGRFEYIKNLLSALNGYNYHLDAKEKFVESIKCPQIKGLLKSCIEDLMEVRGVKRKYECDF